jgi:hypothetical protein
MPNKTPNDVSRRSFIAACGAAAATAALPAVALGKASGWRSHLEPLQRSIRAEVEAFAESVRPMFERGELYAARSPEDDDTPFPETAHGRLEALVTEHFGLKVTERELGDFIEYDGDAVAAYALLACSPRGEALRSTHYHPAYHALEAISWDVIAIARARGWYVPTASECGDPIDALKRMEVLS